MKKEIMLIFVFMVLAMTGCSQTTDSLNGKWIATTDNQKIYQIDKNGNINGGKEDYILECDGNGKYTLTLENNQTKKGTYTIDDKNITFKDESNLLVGICELANNDEIICNETSTYASKYTKYSK